MFFIYIHTFSLHNISVYFKYKIRKKGKRGQANWGRSGAARLETARVIWKVRSPCRHPSLPLRPKKDHGDSPTDPSKNKRSWVPARRLEASGISSREFACEGSCGFSSSVGGLGDGVRFEPRPAAGLRCRGIGRDAATAGASGYARVRPRGCLPAARDGGVDCRQRAHLSPPRRARRDPALGHARLLQPAAHHRGTHPVSIAQLELRKRNSCTRIEIPPLFFFPSGGMW